VTVPVPGTTNGLPYASVSNLSIKSQGVWFTPILCDPPAPPASDT